MNDDIDKTNAPNEAEDRRDEPVAPAKSAGRPSLLDEIEEDEALKNRTPPNSALLELADRYPPPDEWLDEEDPCSVLQQTAETNA